MEKLLAIDVGNSNTVIGLFDGQRLKWHRRFETTKTLSLLKKIWLKKVDGIVVASVVPSLDQPFRKLLKKKFSVEPIFVTSKTKLPIRIKTKIPLQVGADRIANAVAAYCLHPTLKKGGRGGFIIIDFGTATTFDVVSERGEYLGGPIIPGLRICARALHEKTAKLPLVKIRKPVRVIGKETVECIQSGLYYGYAGMVDRLVEKIQKEYGKKMTVIATGGLAPVISKECRSIEGVDLFLTLRGLKIIHQHHA